MASTKRFLKLAELWPEDALNRSLNLRTVLAEQASNLENKSLTSKLPRPESQVEAIEELLENKSKKMFPLTSRLMEPKGKPTYYKELEEQLTEGPSPPSMWQKVRAFVTNTPAA
ncbi:uncharacterized protein V1516DRAFT_670836 [Lipomyces oligophaga]|uniref:uncharacterized protein n=1 Tax=Lipomyces oligophaga TaxID=45792 RepID=UPI0034CF27DC